MTRYSSTMTEALQEIREGFSPKQIKMAIGIASDKRYAGGNMTGAVKAIEKIKKGLADHPQVAAVLKRQNEDIEEELDEGKMKDLAIKIDDIVAKMKKDSKMKSFADKFKKDAMKSMDISKSLEKVLPDYVAGKDIQKLMAEEVEIDELKMNDPKLNKIFDKLKPKGTVKLKTSSSISKGTEFVDYVVKSKNKLKNGVEKITLATKDNPTSVKKFLYKRDGKVTFAIGDMGASIDDIKEAAHELAEKLKVSDGIGAWIKDFMKSDAPQFDGKNMDARRKMAIAAFADAGGKLEEEDEKKPDKPDSAKAVDQARDDKKKTRIAQLQLQIAKASEMINKLNSQEKPDA